MTNDLLERRAERGTPRGAANVWANAQTPPPPIPEGTNWAFRMALAGFIGLLTLGLIAISRPASDELDTVNDPTQQEQPAPTSTTSSEPLPASLGIDGMEFSSVSRPEHPDFDADDLFGAGVPFDRPAQFDSVVRNIFYADPAAPFEGPIFAFVVFEDGEFVPLAANMSAEEVATMTERVVVSGGTPTLPNSGLEVVADFDSRTFDSGEFRWGFNFTSEEELVDLRAQTSPDDQVTVWHWLAELLPTAGEDERASLDGVEVLDHSGVRVDYSTGTRNEVLWVDGDFAYLLQSATSEHLATDFAPRVQAIDRVEWVENVQASPSVVVVPSEPPTISDLLVISLFYILGVVFLIMMVIPAIKILKDNYS